LMREVEIDLSEDFPSPFLHYKEPVISIYLFLIFVQLLD